MVPLKTGIMNKAFHVISDVANIPDSIIKKT